MIMNRNKKPERPKHVHYTITCGQCQNSFTSCGLPCFIRCWYCGILLILWEEG